MNRLEASQICFGMILENRKSPKAFLADDFSEQYVDAVEYCQRNDDWCKEDLVKIIAPSFMQDATYAIKSLNGMGDTTDWLTVLRGFAEDEKLGDVLEKSGRNLKKGKDIDYLSLSGHIQSRVMQQSTGLTRGSEIDCENYQPFIKSGYAPFDNVLGGIPADGPIVVYGLTGVGKSKFLANLTSHFLHEHPDKTAAIYTLEMSAEHWKWRETNMYKHLNDVLDRLFISGSVKSVEELIAEISTRQVGLVGIDDVDGLARENSAAEFERIYKKIKEICRFLKIPAVALAQPNRNAKLAGKFLSRYSIAWSGAAEDSAAMLIALQRGNELDMDYGDDETAPFPLYDEDHEYIICYKSRDGWPADYPERYPNGQRGPGAIILEQDRSHLWEGNAIGGENGTLWREFATRKLVKKKKKVRFEE